MQPMMNPEFETKVLEQIERLQNRSLAEIQTDVARKRIGWLTQHPPASLTGAISPRQAFDILFFEYMGLSPADLPVVSETTQEIVWRSQNPCPTLEACLRLGLDTHRVCRSAYEKSTQAFLSRIDPQLRFLRSYTEIRPHTDYCLERIVRIDFDAAMAIAIEEAKQSRREGNKGYGAVVLMGEQLLSAVHDTAATAKDPSRHAEVNAIRLAAERLGDADLSGGVLVSTCEPCPMCSSLAVWANLTTIVYGVSIEETARMGKARIRISAQEIVDRSPAMVEVIGGVLAAECRKLYE
jgi:tRNA(Arg) A34 adenosine deaminase TadA